MRHGKETGTAEADQLERLQNRASKAVWLGEVEVPDKAAAIETAAAEFKVPATKMMAIRR